MLILVGECNLEWSQALGILLVDEVKCLGSRTINMVFFTHSTMECTYLCIFGHSEKVKDICTEELSDRGPPFLKRKGQLEIRVKKASLIRRFILMHYP